MTYSRDFWERVLRTFYTAFIAVALPLALAHLAGIAEDVASGNWSALRSVGVAVGTAGLSAAVTATKALIARGVGANPEDGSLKGATNGGE